MVDWAALSQEPRQQIQGPDLYSVWFCLVLEHYLENVFLSKNSQLLLLKCSGFCFFCSNRVSNLPFCVIPFCATPLAAPPNSAFPFCPRGCFSEHWLDPSGNSRFGEHWNGSLCVCVHLSTWRCGGERGHRFIHLTSSIWTRFYLEHSGEQAVAGVDHTVGMFVV